MSPVLIKSERPCDFEDTSRRQSVGRGSYSADARVKSEPLSDGEIRSSESPPKKRSRGDTAGRDINSGNDNRRGYLEENSSHSSNRRDGSDRRRERDGEFNKDDLQRERDMRIRERDTEVREKRLDQRDRERSSYDKYNDGRRERSYEDRSYRSERSRDDYSDDTRKERDRYRR